MARGPSPGAFVRVRERADGVGKFIEADGRVAQIEYFASPAGPRLHRVSVPSSHLEEVELAAQTRVYWFDESKTAWRFGRVDGGLVSAQALRAAEDHYYVRFPNGKEARIPQSLLYARWSHPVDDPTDYLVARITETPFFFEGRRLIMEYLARERAAFGGMTGLASAAVELLEHQVTTVRRVLADPIERYLLADEVGLGKTIEAGVLIRQHLIDFPREARVLVVVPGHLVHQWRSELAQKFFVHENSPVTVLPEEAVRAGTFGPDGLTMLVVDEAQRAASRAFDPEPEKRRLYEVLRTLAAQVPCVILLSGTPVLHQEDGFLAMLHLLDPNGYRPEEREHFRRRVRDRQIIADARLDLTDNASPLFAEESVAKLERSFGDDLRLMTLCREVRAHLGNDPADPGRIRALRALRTHLTETYRLHRRLLRTRRDDPRVRDLLPRRTGAIPLRYDDQARREAFDFVEAWRHALPGADEGVGDRAVSARLFALWVESALSHPLVLLRRIDARLELRCGGRSPLLSVAERELLASPWAFQGEEGLLRERRELIARVLDEEPRAERLAEWLRSNTDVRKVILFVDDREVADRAAEHLARLLGSTAVLRHELRADRERVFHETAAVRILVCDANAEEGLNLQRVGAAVVHYDLPLEPMRIEQRIGRVDRIEARGRLRIAVLTSGCRYEAQWLACLADAVRVFHQSVAPLQYLLLEAVGRIRSRLVDDGSAAIELEAGRMRHEHEGLDAELRRIHAQEALDAFDADPESERAFFEALEQADRIAEEEGSDAFDAWLVDRLRFVHREVSPESFRYAHDYRHPTLVPLQEVMVRFGSSVDCDPRARHSRSELPFRLVTFERAIAEGRRVELLRVGHPFVTAMEALLRADDRGTAFAMWRHVPGLTIQWPRVFFRFDFVIEADLSHARSLVDQNRASPEALRRRADDAFPVQYCTVWLDSDLGEVAEVSLLELLQLPYTKQRRSDGGNDINLRPEHWAAVDAVVSLGAWGDLCVRARRTAERLLRSKTDFQEWRRSHAGRLREAALSVDDALRSRIAHLTGSARASEERMADFERRLSEALAAGIEVPSLRVDSVGAVFLSSTPLLGVAE